MRLLERWRASRVARAERQRLESLEWLKRRRVELRAEAESLRRTGQSAADSDSDMFGTPTYSGWGTQNRYLDRAARAEEQAHEIDARIAELETP